MANQELFHRGGRQITRCQVKGKGSGTYVTPKFSHYQRQLFRHCFEAKLMKNKFYDHVVPIMPFYNENDDDDDDEGLHRPQRRWLHCRSHKARPPELPFNIKAHFRQPSTLFERIHQITQGWDVKAKVSSSDMTKFHWPTSTWLRSKKLFMKLKTNQKYLSSAKTKKVFRFLPTCEAALDVAFKKQFCQYKQTAKDPDFVLSIFITWFCG